MSAAQAAAMQYAYNPGYYNPQFPGYPPQMYYNPQPGMPRTVAPPQWGYWYPAVP